MENTNQFTIDNRNIKEIKIKEKYYNLDTKVNIENVALKYWKIYMMI